MALDPENPTYEDIRKACVSEGEYAVILEMSVGPVSCRFKNKRKSSQMDFDLAKTFYRVDANKWRELAKQHDDYVKANIARHDWKDVAARFAVETVRVDVLREDAEEWFELLYARLQRKEGLVGARPDSRA